MPSTKYSNITGLSGQSIATFPVGDDYKPFLKELDAALKYQSLTIHIFDNATSDLLEVFTHKPDNGNTESKTTSANKKLITDIIKRGKPELISHTKQKQKKHSTLMTEHFMVFPLIHESHCSGCLVITRVSEDAFTTTEFRDVESLTPNAILIVQNILLLKQLNEKEEAIRAVRNLLAQTQQDLNKAEFTVEKSLNTRRDFLNRMNHELRTPINGVLGLTHILLSNPHNEKNREYLQSIKTSGEHLLTLINNILDASDVETGRLSLEEINFNPRELIRSVQQVMSSKAREKNLELKVNLKKLPKYVTGDAIRLNQILLNLISNAIKFTGRGHIAIKSEVIKSKENMVWLKFVVADTGSGIPEDRLKTIFDNFSGAANHPDGAGFGLHVVKRLTEFQGGSVAVKSNSGKGSIFTVVLPYKISKQMPVAETTSKELKPFQNVRILLAEDNLINQVVAIRTLERWNIHVTLAKNGREAIQKLEEQSFDLVIMDIQMPEMDGIEASCRIRRHFPEPVKDIPIMAMTACLGSDSIESFHKAGINDYLAKPFKPQELYRKITRLLPAKEQGRETRK